VRGCAPPPSRKSRATADAGSAVAWLDFGGEPVYSARRMNYFIQLRGLMIEVMLPLALLVAAGAFWPRIFADAQPDVLRTQLNRVIMYVFYPCILVSLAAGQKPFRSNAGGPGDRRHVGQYI
jgi:hypothetical protein